MAGKAKDFQFTKDEMREINNYLFSLEPEDRQQVLQTYADLSAEEQAKVNRNILNISSQTDQMKNAVRGAKEISAQAPLGERILNRVQSSLGPAGQFVGSAAGALLGTRAKRPILGEFLGGSAGSLVGESAEEVMRAVRGIPSAFTSEEQRGKFLSDVAIGVGSEAAIGVPLNAGKAIFSGVGKNVGRAVIGDEVFDRGLERGFRKILNTADIPDDVAPDLAKRLGKFFPKVRGVAGKNVERAIKENNVVRSTGAIKETVESIAKETDIDDLEISGAAKKDLKRAFSLAKDLPEEASIMDIWQARRKFDDIVFKRKIKDEDTLRIIGEIRTSFNAPITQADESISKAFRNYSAVIQSQQNLGRNFETTPLANATIEQIARGEDVTADKAESFARSLFSGSKNQIRKQIRNLETLLEKDDKVLEDLLDLAAAEKITQSEAGGGIVDLFGRVLFSTIGGKRGVANIGAGFQSPVGRALRAGVNAGISGAPALAAEGLRDPDKPIQPRDVLNAIPVQ